MFKYEQPKVKYLINPIILSVYEIVKTTEYVFGNKLPNLDDFFHPNKNSHHNYTAIFILLFYPTSFLFNFILFLDFPDLSHLFGDISKISTIIISLNLIQISLKICACSLMCGGKILSQNPQQKKYYFLLGGKHSNWKYIFNAISKIIKIPSLKSIC